MQAVFEKIIEKLEKEKVKGIYDSSSIIGEKNVWAEAIEIVKQEAEEYKDRLVSAEAYKQVVWERDIAIEQLHELGFELGEDVSNNGWIPCSERLPEERDWYLAVFEEVDTGFIGLPYIADYLMGSHTEFTTEDGWIIANCTDIEEDRAEYYKKLKCIAWQPLPVVYKPKEE